MSALRLRDAAADDAPAIAALHTANWRQAYVDVLRPEYLAGPVEGERLEVWTARLSGPAPNQEVVIAEDKAEQLAGFACLYHAADSRLGGFVDNLHSAACAGRASARGCCVRPRGGSPRATRTAAWLWVFEKNTPARGFYDALGAKVVERVVSDWNQAPGEMRLRCRWPRAAELARVQERQSISPNASTARPRSV